MTAAQSHQMLLNSGSEAFGSFASNIAELQSLVHQLACLPGPLIALVRMILFSAARLSFEIRVRLLSLQAARESEGVFFLSAQGENSAWVRDDKGGAWAEDAATQSEAAVSGFMKEQIKLILHDLTLIRHIEMAASRM